MDTVALIIPAAGSGSRLNRPLPKPFVEVKGTTILEHTIDCFLPLEGLRQIIVATAHEYLEKAETILDNLDVNSAVKIGCVIGGRERQHSIQNALDQVGGSDLVAVHDAVRPFVRLEVINNCCQVAATHGASVAGVPAKDTIKKVDENQFILETPERKYLWQAQTPQVFRRELLVRAYEEAQKDNFIGTDDASLVERLGATIRMVESDRMNFKITYPLDLRLARILIEERKNK